MTPSPAEKPVQPIYEPTPEGLGLALEDAISQHATAVVHNEAERGDVYGRTGGDSLLLYPDPYDRRKTIRIAALGKNADDRRFPATNGISLNLKDKRNPSSGTFRVSGSAGTRSVMEFGTNPRLGSAELMPYGLTEQGYSGLIEAITTASPDRPPSKPSRFIAKIGKTAQRSI